MAVNCLRGQVAIFLANETLELACVKSIFPPCLLCVSVPEWSLGGKGLLSRELPVQALDMGNPKTSIMAEPLSSGLGFASPFGGEISAFLGQAFLTQHVWQARAAKNYQDVWVPWVPEQKMSSDRSWHLLYYSPSGSISLSCCTQPRGFNSRWLIQEITFCLSPHPTIPTLPKQWCPLCLLSSYPSHYKGILAAWSSSPCLCLLAACPGQQQGAGDSPADMQGTPQSLAETCPKPSRLLCMILLESASPHTWTRARCWTEPLFFQLHLAVFRRHLSASLKTNKTNKNPTEKKPQSHFPPFPPPTPALWDRERVLQWNESDESVFFWALFSNVSVVKVKKSEMRCL